MIKTNRPDMVGNVKDVSAQSTKNDTINLDLRVNGERKNIKGRKQPAPTDEEAEMLNLIEETNSVSGYVSQGANSSISVSKRYGL